MTLGKGNGAGPPPIAAIDRYILVVTPLQPFVAWVNSVEEQLEEDSRLSLSEAQADFKGTYLVPFYDYPAHAIAWVRDHFDLIFEQELSGAYVDPEVWPPNRTVEMFEAWFGLELLEPPLDLFDAPLKSL